VTNHLELYGYKKDPTRAPLEEIKWLKYGNGHAIMSCFDFSPYKNKSLILISVKFQNF
jgi:hypothetical protein